MAEDGKKKEQGFKTLKIVFFVCIAVYCGLLLAGKIPSENRLGPWEYGIVVLGILILLGFFDRVAEFSFGKEGVKLTLDKIEAEQDRMSGEIHGLQVALRGLVTKYEIGHLRAMDTAAAYMVKYGDDFFEEIKRLDAKGFIRPCHAGGFNAIREENKNTPLVEFDLKHYMQLTKEGKEYLDVLSTLFKGK